MSDGLALEFTQACRAGDVSPELRRDLVGCWVAVSNCGGAVGFPFPPVTASVVQPVADRLIAGLDPESSRLLLATAGGGLAGWLSIRRDPAPLVRHWGTIGSVQTHPRFRGRGAGTALMNRAREVARQDMGLEQLHLAVRGGMGLEGFYRRLGWREAGRWPGALRLGPGDDRDEVLMFLAPL